MARTFFYGERREDPRRCRVCGNLTLPAATRITKSILVALIGALLMYIVLDVAHNGRLDASLAAYVHQQWRAR
jgi:hypothetical protein